jgi:hypothetical protein
MAAKMTAAVTLASVKTLAGCGGSAAGVSGSIADPRPFPTRALCDSNGNIQVALTNASGHIIARDNAPFTWRSGECVIAFSFSDVPRLAGYGIRVPGLGAGTTWLTLAQAAKPVTLTLSQ